MADRGNGTDGRRREKHFRSALLICAGGAVMVAAAMFMLGDGDGGDSTLAIGAAGAICLVAGLTAIWIFRRGEAARPPAGPGSYRDRVQRDRISSIMVLPLTTLGLTALGMSNSADWLAGDRRLSAIVLAVAVLANTLLIPAMVMGWDVTGRREKRLLDDELTRAYRAEAMTAAFWVLLAGATCAYLVGLWKPHVAVILLPAVLWAATATAALRFALLHRAADQDE